MAKERAMLFSDSMGSAGSAWGVDRAALFDPRRKARAHLGEGAALRVRYEYSMTADSLATVGRDDGAAHQ